MDQPSGKRPLRKNPFFWGALAGLVLVPAIRPLMRRVPEPPPVAGQMARIALTDHAGSAVSSGDLRDHVYLATLAPTEPQLAALVTLQQRCRRMGVKLWLVTFAATEARALAAQIEQRGGEVGGQPQRWLVLAGWPEAIPARLDRERAVLVDGDGGLRGAFAIDDRGLDEVFHRSQHVMSLRRSWR